MECWRSSSLNRTMLRALLSSAPDPAGFNKLSGAGTRACMANVRLQGVAAGQAKECDTGVWLWHACSESHHPASRIYGFVT